MTDSNRSALLPTLDPRRLELILYPTEQCNFRCTYCYEDFLLGKMPPEVISGVKRLISERVANIQLLEFSWFGGEPLAAKDVMFELCEYAVAACASHGVRLAGQVTTNGYFLDVDTARRLQGYGQGSYQISIDGYGAAHDRTRKLMSGGGTFERIWSNMLALRDSDIQFHILFRIHLTSDNLASMEQLGHVMRKEFLHDSRFAVFLKTIENLGNDAANAIMIPKAEREAAYRRLAVAFGLAPAGAAEAAGAPPGDAAKAGGDATGAAPATPQPAPRSREPLPTVCYAARPNSLAIRANGAVQKCTVMMNDDRNHLGQLGADGKMTLDRGKMAFWMRGYDTLDAGELQCPASTPRPAAGARKTIPIVAAA